LIVFLLYFFEFSLACSLHIALTHVALAQVVEVAEPQEKMMTVDQRLKDVMRNLSYRDVIRTIFLFSAIKHKQFEIIEELIKNVNADWAVDESLDRPCEFFCFHPNNLSLSNC
jgi:hypothetical protein